jgi:hypothetical protein
MVARVVGVSQVGVGIQDLETQIIMVGTGLMRMAVVTPLTAATEMASRLPMMNADQLGDEMIDRTLGYLQDLRQSPVTIFLMMEGDQMGVTGIDLDLMIWIANAPFKEADLLELVSTHTYQVMLQTAADRREKIVQGMIVEDERTEIEIEID